MTVSELLARAEYCRDLARRARHDLISNEAEKTRFRRFIDDLEQEAARVEKQAADAG